LSYFEGKKSFFYIEPFWKAEAMLHKDDQEKNFSDNGGPQTMVGHKQYCNNQPNTVHTP